MITLTQIIQAVGFAILAFGAFISLGGIINLIATAKAQKIRGTITNYVQEYTTRGFLWKAKVEYTLNDITNFYITKSRMFTRGSDTVYLYITKRGKVIEKENAIWNIIFGVFIIAVSMLIFRIASQQL